MRYLDLGPEVGVIAISPGLTEVAYFDTSPESDSREFSGAWNVFPFFDNGVLLVSDTNRGLFILRASLAERKRTAGELGRARDALTAQQAASERQVQRMAEDLADTIVVVCVHGSLAGCPQPH